MEENKIRVILAVILTLLKVDRCFTMLTELQKSRKRLSIKVFKAKSAKGVNRLEPPFPACKAPIVGSSPTIGSIFQRPRPQAVGTEARAERLFHARNKALLITGKRSLSPSPHTHSRSYWCPESSAYTFRPRLPCWSDSDFRYSGGRSMNSTAFPVAQPASL